jgi:nucleotide-binding universal stress UspA family protein
MDDADRRRGRIVLAIDTGSLIGPALEVAAALAAGLQSELSALFVEDERLLRLAALPMVHEIGFSSAQRQRIELQDMERGLRIQAERLRQAVSQTARRLTLTWTLEVVRGEILSTSLGRMRPEDLLVVGKARLPRLALGGVPARGGAFPALAARPVTVLFNGSDSALRALEAGHAIARTIPTELSLLIPASTPQAFEEHRVRAARWLAERGAAARFLNVASRDPTALAAAVRSQGGGILVWPTPPDNRELAALARLIEEVGCPVVVLP